MHILIEANWITCNHEFLCLNFLSKFKNNSKWTWIQILNNMKWLSQIWMFYNSVIVSKMELSTIFCLLSIMFIVISFFIIFICIFWNTDLYLFTFFPSWASTYPLVDNKPFLITRCLWNITFTNDIVYGFRFIHNWFKNFFFIRISKYIQYGFC